MASDDYDTVEKESALFNMAIDTLSRLGGILKDIKIVDTNIDLCKEDKQEMKLNLVRQFFLQSSPLLTSEIIQKYKEEIISFELKTTQVCENRGYGSTKMLGEGIVYDLKLARRLDNILLELIIHLQEKGHFMPSYQEEGWD